MSPGVIRDGFVPWPADQARRYRGTGCWEGRTLGSFLGEWADRSGSRVALIDGPHRLTYLELAERTDALASGLAAEGYRAGDTVLVQLPNCWEFVVVTLACFRLGVVPVMMLPPHRRYELASIGAHVRAHALIVPTTWRGFDHQGLARQVAKELPEPARVLAVGDPHDIPADHVDVRALIGRPGDAAERRRRLDADAPDPGDVALFLLSGGTTGVPKVISRTHDDYVYNIRRVVERCGFDEDTVQLSVLPAGHNFPLANPGILGSFFAGGRSVLLSSPRPELVFEAVETHGITHTSAVPSIVLKWLDEAETTGRDLSSLRAVHVGGSVLSPEVAARIGPTLGCRLQQVYGMAEGLVCYTPLDAPDDVAHATQGTPISPHDELRIVDPDGAEVRPGEIGELLTRGPYTPPGYFGVPEQNKSSFTPDGWYRTGDLIRVTTEGNVVVCGRVKDLVNRAGEKISAGEIETLVQEMPEVAEAAVIAVPDPDVGERVGLVVRLRPGFTLTLQDVAAALAIRGVAAFKIPERLDVLAELPHTPVGKVDKKALSAAVSALAAPEPPGPARPGRR